MDSPESVTLSGEALEGFPFPGARPRFLAMNVPQRVRLGRIRRKANPVAPRLSAYLLERKVSLPVSVDYTAKAQAALSHMYMNDTYGCCVISDAYHSVGVWSGNDTGTPIIGTDREVYQMYQTICGPGDRGCVITDVLDYRRDHGLPFQGKVHRIDGYVSIDWTNIEEVKTAIYLLPCMPLGINLPKDWTTKRVWDVTNSQIVGGHDVPTVGYDGDGVYIASWGRVYLITWQAFLQRKWLEECYAVLSPDWYNDDRLAPNGVDVATLRADLAKLGQGIIPPIPDPNPPAPFPPIPPAPPAPSPPALIAVPPVVGMQFAAAKVWIERAGLQASGPAGVDPAGMVAAQSPMSGTLVPQGTIVILVVPPPSPFPTPTPTPVPPTPPAPPTEKATILVDFDKRSIEIH